ncbi:MAG: hypothetical protein M3Q64_01675 [bacterium]|nr:hypothetical protein [bacterium]
MIPNERNRHHRRNEDSRPDPDDRSGWYQERKTRSGYKVDGGLDPGGYFTRPRPWGRVTLYRDNDTLTVRTNGYEPRRVFIEPSSRDYDYRRYDDNRYYRQQNYPYYNQRRQYVYVQP